MAAGDTPSRLKAFKKLREEIDAELSGAITIEQAVGYGLEEHGRSFAVRIWQNCIDAIALRKKLVKRGSILVKRREGKDVQVWIKPEQPKQEENELPGSNGTHDGGDVGETERPGEEAGISDQTAA